MAKLFFFLIFCNMNSDITIALFGDKFDKHNFDWHQKDGEYVTHDMGATIELYDNGDTLYYKRVKPDSSAMEYRMAFYKDCLTVAATAVKFYDVYIWGKREYDRQGNLISVENADAPYNYSVDDVVQWVEDKYNVDLTKKPRWAMMNRSPNPIPHYMLRFIDNDGQRIVYSIDARDGSLIYENIAGEEKTYKDVRDWWRNPDGTKVKRR